MGVALGGAMEDDHYHLFWASDTCVLVNTSVRSLKNGCEGELGKCKAPFGGNNRYSAAEFYSILGAFSMSVAVASLYTSKPAKTCSKNSK